MRKKGEERGKLDETRLRFGPSCSDLHWREAGPVAGQKRPRDVRKWVIGAPLRIARGEL